MAHRNKFQLQITMGPYNEKISYQGQSKSCYICSSTDHQAKDCNTKCWKCRNLGLKGKQCTNEEICNIFNMKGHTYFDCPTSFSNKTKKFTKMMRALETEQPQMMESERDSIPESRQSSSISNTMEPTLTSTADVTRTIQGANELK